jgi:tetratricopeptide (TPR) repeat protein
MSNFISQEAANETVADITEADLLRVLARQPANREALALLGRIYRNDGRPADAVRVLEQAIATGGAENFGDCDELCELLFIHALWDDPGEFERTWERLLAVTPEEPAARNWLSDRVLRLAGEFFHARSFTRARRLFRCVYEEWVADPETRRQVIETGPLVTLFAEAAELIEDEAAGDSLRRYAFCRYMDTDRTVPQETRGAVARAVCDDAARNPERARDLLERIAGRYPYVARDNPELIAAVRQAAGLPADPGEFGLE